MGCCTDPSDEDSNAEETALKSDTEFRGPVSKRSCTDVICCLLFFIFIVVWCIIFLIAYSYGDPSRLLKPRDTQGRVCGVDPGVEHKRYLFFFDLTQCGIQSLITECITPQVCVESCPVDKWFINANTTKSDAAKLICKTNTDLNNTVDDLVRTGQCAPYYVPSDIVAGRCFPSNLDSHVHDIFNSYLYLSPGKIDLESLQLLMKNIKYVIRYALIQQLLENVALDVVVLWWQILVGFVAAMLVSFIYIMTLRIIAAILIYASIVAFVLIAGYGCYYTMSKYLALKGIEKEITEQMVMIKSVGFSTTENIKSGFTYLGEQETTWLVLFIIILIVLVVVLLIVIFLRKRISIAIALIGQASKAVSSIASSLFFPIIPFILHLIFFAFFCYTAFLLESSRQRNLCPDEDESNTTSQQQITSISHQKQDSTFKSGIKSIFNQQIDDTSSQESNMTLHQGLNSIFQQVMNSTFKQECSNEVHPLSPYISYLQFYNVFGLYWSAFFISAFGEMVLAGAYASWYWTLDKSKDVPTCAITQSLGRTLRYHVGTLAFGSLIIAVVRMIRTIMEYIDYKIRQHTDSKVVKFLMCCCRCCLWCLEKFLKYINRNAYVYCAIYGKNFCKSARKAISLIFRNAARAVVLDKVTDFLLFIGKMVICAGMAAMSFLFFNGDLVDINDYNSALNYYQTPVIIITIGTYFISSSFFSVYAMAVDTVFLCFLEDCEKNDGTSDKPYYMSKGLRKILDKKNENQETELDRFG